MNYIPEYRLFEDDNRRMIGSLLGPKDGYLAGTVTYHPKNDNDVLYWSSLKDILVIHREGKFYGRNNVSNEAQIRGYYGEIEYNGLDSHWKLLKENPYAL